ncbi:MAG: PIN domain-containing protein [Magnetococcales bacterium]|nr:PIN domain-containing protein [Magnetococcales bacterium]MBF0149427.1 PIN domain-containing protein [Magnetococcales bacterium]MBF0171921.1 PIN domain-containing protein [Magnetococcales bacterium]MBF0630496.1 PIN domain-containing protein [Magnetococcales bacterium]
MSGERYTFDTNILIYALDREAGRKHAIASALLDQAVAENCVLMLQSLGEFFRAATAKGKMPIAEASDQVRDWLALFQVQPAGISTITKALRAVQNHNLSFWDAMLWACAKEAGCAIVVSEDFQHGRLLEGVRFHNPFLDTSGSNENKGR